MPCTVVSAYNDIGTSNCVWQPFAINSVKKACRNQGDMLKPIVYCPHQRNFTRALALNIIPTPLNCIVKCVTYILLAIILLHV